MRPLDTAMAGGEDSDDFSTDFKPSRSDVRIGSWMQTYSGIAYFPLDPRVDEICIEDIAHALSMLCRYGGHAKRFYSVAEHSYHASFLVPHEHAMAALMHDAPEAYCGDVVRPLKRHLGHYAEIEALNWRAISWKFGLPFTLPQCVHDADVAMFFAEAKVLVGEPARPGWGMGCTTPLSYDPALIECWTPEVAEIQFLERFRELRGGAR